MKTIAGFPYFEVQFTREGVLFLPTERDDLLGFLQQNQPSDLFVISHGWLTDMQDAKQLYTKFFQQVRQVINDGHAPPLGQRTFAVLGVLWPSKKFADQALISGGAADLEGALLKRVGEQLDGLKELFDEPNAEAEIAELKVLIAQLEDNSELGTDFANRVRNLLTQGVTDEEDGSEALFTLSADEIMANLSEPILAESEAASEGGAADMGDGDGLDGGAAGVLSPGGILGAATNLLNLVTYYEMKQRAGAVGMKGLHQLLQTIHAQSPNLKLHLIGHSFGGRVVAAAALGTGAQPTLTIQTLSLLQTAFSHYGFASQFDGVKDGFFRKVFDSHSVSGATLITHTKNDKAVGLAYPIASALVKDNAAALGDANDRYGAIGSNGALKTPEAISGLVLQEVGTTYTFQPGKLHNLLSDAYISNHGDICKPEVAYAVLAAVAMS